MSLYSIVLLDLKNIKKFSGDNQEVSAATTTINMLLLNRRNEDLHCKDVLMLNESPFEHTKLH